MLFCPKCFDDVHILAIDLGELNNQSEMIVMHGRDPQQRASILPIECNLLLAKPSRVV